MVMDTQINRNVLSLGPKGHGCLKFFYYKVNLPQTHCYAIKSTPKM